MAARKVLNWEPKVSLEEGMRETYRWIADQLRAQGRLVESEVQTQAVAK